MRILCLIRCRLVLTPRQGLHTPRDQHARHQVAPDPTPHMGHHQPHERSSMTIIEYLNARLDEDEAKAEAARGATWVASLRGGVVVLYYTHGHTSAGCDGGLALSGAEFMAHFAPARALREIVAKRFLIDQWADGYSTKPLCVGVEEADAADVLRSLASVYADHPDYCR